jgi:hypothetical protein
MHAGNKRDDERNDAHGTQNQAGLGGGRCPVPWNKRLLRQSDSVDEPNFQLHSGMAN